MSPILRLISASDTYPLRGPILRAGMPPEASVFPGDELESTMHLGAFDQDLLVGVCTLLAAPLPERPELTLAWQLRGMATLPQVRGTGFGRALIRQSLEQCRAAGGQLLWCNARVPASTFYQKMGLQIIGAPFEIPTAGPHVRMWTPVRETSDTL